MVKDQHPNSVKEATTSILPVWLDAFKVLLNIEPKHEVENTPNWDGLAIRIQIFKVGFVSAVSTTTALNSKFYQTLDTVHTSFPRALAPYLQDILTSSLHHLNVLFPTFYACYVISTASVPASSEDETIELTQLICPIFDFVSNSARGGKATDWFDQSNLSAVVGSIFNWAQMTSDDVSSGIDVECNDTDHSSLGRRVG